MASAGDLKNIIILTVLVIGSLIALNMFFPDIISQIQGGAGFLTSQVFIGVAFIGVGLYVLVKKLPGGGIGTNEAIASAVLVFGILVFFKWLPFAVLMSSVAPLSTSTIQQNIQLDPNNIINTFIGGFFSLVVYFAVKKR